MTAFFHLYTNDKGLKVGFLCMANTFDEAAEVADKLVTAGSVADSVWIIEAAELRYLRDSINSALAWPPTSSSLTDKQKSNI